MKDLLEYLVKKIVKNSDEVVVEEDSQNDFVNLRLTVAQEDMGQVIGKKGRIIRAIRDVVRILAVKQNKKVNVELLEKTSSEN